MSGDVETKATFKKAFVKTMSGRFRQKKYYTTKEKVYEAIINVSTMSGDVIIR